MILCAIDFPIICSLLYNVDNHNNPTNCESQNISPICGIGIMNGIQIKSSKLNSCEACLDENIKFSVSMSCESYPTDAVFCDPSESKKNLRCEFGSEEVCGVNYLSSKWTFQNKCRACKQNEIVYYTPGNC